MLKSMAGFDPKDSTSVDCGAGFREAPSASRVKG
jgi:hypothetical protein